MFISVRFDDVGLLQSRVDLLIRNRGELDAGFVEGLPVAQRRKQGRLGCVRETMEVSVGVYKILHEGMVYVSVVVPCPVREDVVVNNMMNNNCPQ